MNKNKKSELTRIHKQFFDAGTGQKLSQPIAKFVDENVYGFGTAVDEKISGIKEFQNLLNNQKKQSKGIDLKWKMKSLHCFISEDENNAVFSDELRLSVVAGGEHIRKYFRFSVVLNYVNNHWKVIHWHGSAPESIESNKDTFGINEWKQKTIELEKIVAERTSELSEKNRELEIESSLERVRAAALSMKSSAEIGKVIFYLYSELTKLDAKLDRCFIMIVNSKTHDITWWLSGKEGLLSENGFLVQNNNFPSHQLYLHYWKKRKKKWQYVLQGKEKKEWDNFGFNKTGLVNLPEQVKKDMASVKKTYLSGSSDSFGCIITGSLEPLSEEHQEIISKFTVVFNQTYTRFLDLQKAEAQAREAQIEVALEKVRSKAMAMHSSAELKEVAREMRIQFGLLRQNELETCAIHLWDVEAGKVEAWAAIRSPDNTGKLIESESDFTIKGVRILEESFKKYLAGEKDYVLINDDAKAREFFKALKETDPKASNFLTYLNKNKKTEGISAYWSISDFSGGSLVLVTQNKPDENSRALLRRFANVFGLAYGRFNDLKKAEAQAREAEIQLALERVRAKSLAMHHTSELQQVIHTVHSELLRLKIAIYGGSFIAINKDVKTTLRCWGAGGTADTSQEVELPPYKKPFLTNLINGIKNGSGFFTEEFTQRQKKDFFNFLFKHEPWSKLNANEKKETLESPGGYTRSCFVSKHTSIFIINQAGVKFSEADNEILKRFGNVFEQAYTRFLDLQKAEAQAREAQIEAALEKVRSRSMAMHKSDELKEVIRLVLEQFVHLNIKAEHAGFYIDYKAHDDMHIWLADPNLEPFFAVLPYFDTPTWNSFRDAKAKGKLLHTDLLDFKEKNKFYKALFKLFIVPEEAKEFYMNCKGLAVSTVLLDSVGLYIENFSAIPYTDEENNILMRFGKVFQQTYTRFLDLQKAEAQAREAQIEAALERVRARTMAMHNSSELAQAADLMFEQVQHLGAELQGVAFAICDKESDMVQKWTSIGIFSHPYNIEPGEQRMYEAWKNQSGLYEEVYEGEKQKKYYEAFMKIPSFREGIQKFIDSGYPLPTWQKNHAVPFKYGYLLFITTKPFDETQIFVRFGKVFEQTYTRFLDLQKAEAQTLRAEQDLIEIIASRKKAEDALTELQATQKQLIQSEKMASLGELTTGIAHEIQNPLNFVNNFSEVSAELVDEMNEEITKGNLDDAKEIANDLKQNLEKINHHGKRAGDIVKGMLQHSRTSSGKKEPTDINALCDEYLRLAYHGLRAKDKSFNAKFETDFDESLSADKAGLPKINVVPQDIGRVILNLINNAFYAVNERKKLNESGYEPTVIVSTKKEEGNVLISVKDNGTGIPQNIVDKIFQPFFTTKPTGSGTGLGLSLSYDIIKAHGGELKVASKEGEGSEFVIYLPIALY